MMQRSTRAILPADLTSGTVVAFRIETRAGWTSPYDGAWGVARVVIVDGYGITMSVREGVHDDVPPPEPLAPVLRRRRWGPDVISDWDDGPMPYIVKVVTPDPVTLCEGRIIGHVAQDSPEEALYRKTYMPGHEKVPMCGWAYLGEELDDETRAVHDRGGFDADVAAELARHKARMDAIEERQRTRLKGLTLENLLGEVPLNTWDARDHPGPVFAKATRAKVGETITALQSLGKKPRRSAVRAELRGLVEWLNGHEALIETVEREELYDMLEEICHAAGQKALVREIDDWRLW